tara:strand:+ start:246 stop:473 length:228 start_codon:yes stop_codon:yes gene_type:complete
MEQLKEKTINTYSMFGNEIVNTKQQWVNRWKDCTVSSLAGLMPMEEYKKLKTRIEELASKDFDYRVELEEREDSE